MANTNTSTGNDGEWTTVNASNSSTNTNQTNQATSEGGGGAAASDAQKLTTYGATISIGYKYDMMMSGDNARFATATAKNHLLQMSKLVPLTIKPRGNKEAEPIVGTSDIAAKLSTIQKPYKEYITIVYDKFIQRRGTCKCLIDIQTDVPTVDALSAWEPYLVKADVKLSIITEREEKKDNMKKALWFSGVQPQHCNKAVVKRNIERLLSEIGRDMPIEVVDCYHALPVDVTENGVISQHKLGTKVLAVKTRKDDVNVLVGNLSKIVNQDKVNIFNDSADLTGIVNPHPTVHAIPFRASSRYQHLLLSKHKQFMDIHKVQFFLRENIDKVIPENRIEDYIKDYAYLSPNENTLRRMIMALTNDQGNQVAEAIYSTQREDFIISCLQGNSKVIADFCDLHALEYKNMWERFDPNYESDLTKEMKALVATIEVEENGVYIAPGKVVDSTQIAPSAWTKKPKITTTNATTPVAMRSELKRTEATISSTMTTAIDKILVSHADQMRVIQNNHKEAMKALETKVQSLETHAIQQGEMINGLLERNDNDQLQLTEGFEKLDKNLAANEESIENIFQDMVTIQDTSNKDRRTVVKAMQQNMETTTKAFGILTEDMTTIRNEILDMSAQADEMENSLLETGKTVDAIFDRALVERSNPRGRIANNAQKRNRSRSSSSLRSTASNSTRRVSTRQRMEADSVGSLEGSNSEDDSQMDDLEEGDEEDDDMNDNHQALFNLELQERDEESLAMDEDGSLSQTQSEHGNAAPLVSGSPQDVDSRRE